MVPRHWHSHPIEDPANMFFSLPSILLAVAGLASSAAAASLQQVSNYGTNPSGAQMFIYVSRGRYSLARSSVLTAAGSRQPQAKPRNRRGNPLLQRNRSSLFLWLDLQGAGRSIWIHRHVCIGWCCFRERGRLTLVMNAVIQTPSCLVAAGMYTRPPLSPTMAAATPSRSETW